MNQYFCGTEKKKKKKSCLQLFCAILNKRSMFIYKVRYLRLQREIRKK